MPRMSVRSRHDGMVLDGVPELIASSLRVSLLLDQGAPLHERVERLVLVEQHTREKHAGVVCGERFLGSA